MKFSKLLNQHVTISGAALNAAGNAVIAGPDQKWFVYVEGLDEWADDDYGKNVEASGLLIRGQLIPEAAVDERGAHSHGAVGKQLFLRDATWTFTSD